MKMDEIIDALPAEDQEMLLRLLTNKDDQGDFLVGTRRIADLVSTYTPHEIGSSAVLRWRRRYLELNSDESV